MLRGLPMPVNPAGPVPPARDISSGASVRIVLKTDQPTGCTVSGAVQDILTRGDHPRGVKVRLTDGRVGRVQMVTAPGDGARVELDGGCDSSAGRNKRDRRRGETGGSATGEPPARLISLDAFMKPAKAKKGNKNGVARTTKNESESVSVLEHEKPKTEMVTCPVCYNFEGDAAAVEHHVVGHF